MKWALVWTCGLLFFTFLSVAATWIELQPEYAENTPDYSPAAAPVTPGTATPDRFGGYSSDAGPAASPATVTPGRELTDEERYPGITERQNTGILILEILFVAALLSDAWTVIRTPHISPGCMEVYPDPEIGWWKYWVLVWLFVIVAAPADCDVTWD